MRSLPTILLACSLALPLVGCGQGDDPPAGDVPPLGEAGALGDVEPGEDFRVKFETSAGDFVVEVHPEWAPRGAARFRELVEEGFYDGNRFFRVVPGFVVQWGLNGDPVVNRSWRMDNIPDDPQVESNDFGYVTFAHAGPGTRTTQLFVNLADNGPSLDPQGFPPFGKVVEGMEVVEKINAEYGQRPDQAAITNQGNAYLNSRFPNLDYVEKATIVPMPAAEELPEPGGTEPEPADPDTESEPAGETPAEPESPEAEPAEVETKKPETEESIEPKGDEEPPVESSSDDVPAETETETDPNS